MRRFADANKRLLSAKDRSTTLQALEKEKHLTVKGKDILRDLLTKNPVKLSEYKKTLDKKEGRFNFLRWAIVAVNHNKLIPGDERFKEYWTGPTTDGGRVVEEYGGMQIMVGRGVDEDDDE